MKRACWLAHLLFLLGCPAADPTPAPGVPPVRTPVGEVRAEVRYQLDRPLAGTAQVTSSQVTADEAWSVKVSFLGLQQFPDTVVEPLSPLSKVVISTRGEKPLRAFTQLLAGARGAWLPSTVPLQAWLLAGRSGPVATLATLRGVVVRDAVAVFEIARERKGAEEHLAILLQRGPAGETLEASAEAEGWGPTFGLRRAELCNEAVVLDTKQVNAGRSGLAIVLKFPGERFGVIAALVEVESTRAEEEQSAHEKALATFQRQVHERPWAPPARQPLEPLPGADPEELLAQASGDSPATARLALACLARASGARLAYEIAIAGDDALLAAVGRELAAPGVTLGWQIERAALRAVETHLAEKPSDPALEGLLVLYAGAVGHQVGELMDCARQAKSLDDLEQRLVVENRELLEHPNLAVRERARAFLEARDEDGAKR